MATVTHTYLVDDLDGSEVDVKNVLLALDGTNYEIDLSAANADRLKEKLARFVDAATPVKAPRSGAARRGSRGKAVHQPPDRDQVQAIREWARSAGYEVPARGRIPRTIHEAFHAAH